jgi:predicted aspartyl protease
VDDEFEYKAPVIRVRVSNPITKSQTTYEALFDTGYDGVILLAWSTYLELGLRKCELPRKLWSTGVSVTGEEFPLRAAHAQVELGERRMLVVAETYRDNSRRLIGRGFTEDYVATLDGPRKELRIVAPACRVL